MTPHYPFDASKLRDLSRSPHHRPYKADILQLKKEVRETPHDLQKLRSLALLCFVAEQYRTSYDCYCELEEHIPENAEVLCGLARLFLHGGEQALSVMYYVKTLEKDPSFFAAYEELGDYYLLHEQYAQAIYFFKKMLVFPEAAGSGHFGLGLAYMAQDLFEDATKSFTASLQAMYSPDRCCHQLGVIAAKNQRWEVALEMFTQELKFNPNSYDANYSMGRVYEEKEMPERALHYYMETIKLNPELPEVYNNIATLYYNFKGDVEKALENLELALEQDPGVEIKMRIYINLYRMHREEGNYDMAAHYYQLYVDANGFLEN